MHMLIPERGLPHVMVKGVEVFLGESGLPRAVRAGVLYEKISGFF